MFGPEAQTQRVFEFKAMGQATATRGYRGYVGTKRRTEFTIETHRVLVLHRRGVSNLAWCSGCAEEVKMITPGEAVMLTHVSSRTIYRWVEADKIHYAETSEGLLLICLNSLIS